jgi:cytochrome o ubiquinol oxidase subunit II
MSAKRKITAVILLALALVVLAGWHIHNNGIAVLQPAGAIGQKQKSLITEAVLLSLVVVVPVYIMLVVFAWKYRESNKKAMYQPDFDHSRVLETVWWGVPLALITILGIITWKSSHDLDPFRPLNTNVAPVTIQVVALQWKWLFIYPDQNVAAVNYAQFPVNTPVKFEITSDAPMNSFWIPKLGGQIYAMSGMTTELNLEASSVGSYDGVSANISGEGFSGMHFTARANTESGYQAWLADLKQKANPLNDLTYAQLAKPSQNNQIAYFGSVKSGLFNSVINKYERPVFKPGDTK